MSIVYCSFNRKPALQARIWQFKINVSAYMLQVKKKDLVTEHPCELY